MFFAEYEAVDRALRHLDGVASAAADLERGKLLHTLALRDRQEHPDERSMFASALEGFRQVGDAAGEAEALFWQGLCLQLFDENDEAAEPMLRGSYDLATAVGDKLTQSYAARHLGFVAASNGAASEARTLFSESIALRTELDFDAGVAAGQLALADFERSQGHIDRAAELLDRAETVAEQIRAPNLQEWIRQARERC